MRKLLAVAITALGLAGCTSWPNKPRVCFAAEPAIAPSSAAENRAIEFVKRKEASSCSPADVECDLQLQREQNGELRVVSSKAFLSGRPPTCTRLEGGFTVYVFSPQSAYERVELGL